MKKVIVDCDNTIGIKGCDVDDGLAILYLLGCENIDIKGITVTYGNSDIDTVYENTQKFLEEINRFNIPLIKGSGISKDCKNEAAEFLVNKAKEYKENLSIIATGSLTNLGKAYELDKNFFDNVNEIVLMGGITEPLIFEKKIMDELNFSCDPISTYNVLNYGNNVSVITGNNCLKALFTLDEYNMELFNKKINIAKYIYEKTSYWFIDNEEEYGINGFYNWDVLAAVYLANPELFNKKYKNIEVLEENLTKGFLNEEENGVILNLPEIKNEYKLKENIYSKWLNISLV
ncbi:nucleoside hydrolase [Miniphocaeibacter massiliensis]|uniref:nucleoside hydrolase n=1 Tax=Miniphocaeibacter massiliensis TaxID=2041841 RepID=UPI000C06D157|nr:nucleoside hydrolase [Miniphocaeibacter massiliensis]